MPLQGRAKLSQLGLGFLRIAELQPADGGVPVMRVGGVNLLHLPTTNSSLSRRVKQADRGLRKAANSSCNLPRSHYEFYHDTRASPGTSRSAKRRSPPS